MTDLRRRMIRDMKRHGLATTTQNVSVGAVQLLAQPCGRSPDRLNEEEIREFFVPLTEARQLAPNTVRGYRFAIKFLYQRTLRRDGPVLNLLRVKRPKRRPVVLRPPEVLIQLAADPHYVGGLIGVLTALHTWTRTRTYPPHVHCRVPAGGVSADREWVSARQNHRVPVKALSKLFRGIFRDLLNRALPDWRVPDTVWHAEWVVYCKPSVQGVDAVLNDLGRYVHRVAITNRRIVGIDDGQVTFRYPKCGQSEWKTLTLAAGEFIRRFLPHVLPKGVHKVRYYGLWAPPHRRLLRQVQRLLAADEPEATPQKTQSPSGQPSSFPLAGALCPYCGQGVRVCIGRGIGASPVHRLRTCSLPCAARVSANKFCHWACTARAQ